MLYRRRVLPQFCQICECVCVCVWGFPDSSVGKEYACNAGEPGSISGSICRRIGYPLQCSWVFLVTRDQMANIHWIIEKAREFQKNIYFCFIDYAKAFDCVDHNKLWKILKDMGIPDHLTCL